MRPPIATGGTPCPTGAVGNARFQSGDDGVNAGVAPPTPEPARGAGRPRVPGPADLPVPRPTGDRPAVSGARHGDARAGRGHAVAARGPRAAVRRERRRRTPATAPCAARACPPSPARPPSAPPHTSWEQPRRGGHTRRIPRPSPGTAPQRPPLRSTTNRRAAGKTRHPGTYLARCAHTPSASHDHQQRHDHRRRRDRRRPPRRGEQPDRHLWPGSTATPASPTGRSSPPATTSRSRRLPPPEPPPWTSPLSGSPSRCRPGGPTQWCYFRPRWRAAHRHPRREPRTAAAPRGRRPRLLTFPRCSASDPGTR